MQLMIKKVLILTIFKAFSPSLLVAKVVSFTYSMKKSSILYDSQSFVFWLFFIHLLFIHPIQSVSFFVVTFCHS